MTVSHREAVRIAMARMRAGRRDIAVAQIANPARRLAAANDPALFLKTYHPHIFTTPWSSAQKAMITSFVEAVRHVGWRAAAAARGEGKSSLAEGLARWAILYGYRRFVVLIQANGFQAVQSLANIKTEFEFNDLLAEDFPEVCLPIRALEGAHQRALSQTVEGVRSRLRWTGNMIVLPEVAGSVAAGAIVLCRGADAAIRGINHEGQRPDLVILDDLETRAGAESATDTNRLERVIETDIVGLAGQAKPISVLLLCTITKRGCVADKFTDLAVKPAWAGVRHKQIGQFPLAHGTLWAKYLDLRRQDMIAGDTHGRHAHQFYLENRDAMEAGAVVSNPYRFDARLLPDGSQTQLSALQACYDLMADIGMENWCSEYQNEPPHPETEESIGISEAIVLKAIVDYPRGCIPDQTQYVTAGIDCGGRLLHWVAVAWQAGCGRIIDYGITPVYSPYEGGLNSDANAQAVEAAIYAALGQWRDELAEGWVLATPGNGPPQVNAAKTPDVVLIDAGWKPAPIFRFVREQPRGRYRATRGFGSGNGQSPYRGPVNSKGAATNRLFGEHWHGSRNLAGHAWLYCLDADYWKQFVQAGFGLGADQAGSVRIFHGEPASHRQFASQIASEVWSQVWRPGKGYQNYWDVRGRQNHWLDALALAAAGAAMLGMRTFGKKQRASKSADAANIPQPGHEPHPSGSAPRQERKRKSSRVGMMEMFA